MTVTLEPLIAALAGAPNLSNGRCKGRWDLWDETELADVVEFTTNQCRTCPVRADCLAWFESLKPSRRPIGVIAGHVVRQHNRELSGVGNPTPESPPSKWNRKEPHK